jgi:hypothetical protein
LTGDVTGQSRVGINNVKRGSCTKRYFCAGAPKTIRHENSQLSMKQKLSQCSTARRWKREPIP